uniref:hypothetical protein n=1 Tax=Peptacetobacter sp. TaxID=2991975 RepID=UPI0026112CF3
MNKKHLSVVMAGAMLASSVAPVLAYKVDESATKEYEVNGSNKGILIRDLRNLLLSKKFANEAANYSGKDKNKHDFRGESIYQIKVGTTEVYGTTEDDVKKLEKAIQEATKGTKIEVVDRGHVVKNDKYYHFAVEKIETTTEKTYDKSSMQTLVADFNDHKDQYPAVYEMKLESDVLTVSIRKAIGENKLETLTFKVGDKQLDFKKPIDKNGDVLDGRNTQSDWSDLVGFKADTNSKVINVGDEIDGKKLAVITVSDVDAKYETVLSDLYDGLLLTEKGQKLLDTIKEYKRDSKLNFTEATLNSSANGIYEIKFVFENTKTGVKSEVVVKSNKKAQLELFMGWMNNG